MNKILALMLVTSGIGFSQSFEIPSQIIGEISTSYAKTLGFDPVPSYIVGYETKRTWNDCGAGPLGKDSVRGGFNLTCTDSFGLLSIDGSGSYVTLNTGWDYMHSALWTKNTLSVGPGMIVRFKDGAQVSVGCSKNFIAPNGGESCGTKVRFTFKNLLLGVTGSFLVFNQPFINPKEHNLVGTSIGVFVGFRHR